MMEVRLGGVPCLGAFQILGALQAKMRLECAEAALERIEPQRHSLQAWVWASVKEPPRLRQQQREKD